MTCVPPQRSQANKRMLNDDCLLHVFSYLPAPKSLPLLQSAGLLSMFCSTETIRFNTYREAHAALLTLPPNIYFHDLFLDFLPTADQMNRLYESWKESLWHGHRLTFSFAWERHSLIYSSVIAGSFRLRDISLHVRGMRSGGVASLNCLLNFMEKPNTQTVLRFQNGVFPSCTLYEDERPSLLWSTITEIHIGEKARFTCLDRLRGCVPNARIFQTP